MNEPLIGSPVSDRFCREIRSKQLPGDSTPQSSSDKVIGSLGIVLAMLHIFQLVGGFKHFSNFHPENWGNDFQFDLRIFFKGGW